MRKKQLRRAEEMLMSCQTKILSCMGVQFLSMEDIKQLSKQLSKKINESYIPDLIMGIERGGVYPAYCLAKEMNLPYTAMDISRKKTYIGNIETDHILFSQRLFNKSERIPEINKESNYNYNGKRVLVIDDDCGSMRTLNLAKSHLEKKASEVKTSVILNQPGKNPDFFADLQFEISKLVKGGKRFPWAQYSPYFKDYQSWLELNQQ